MDKNIVFEIVSNEKIAESTYKMVLSGDTRYITNEGQFVNIALDGLYLRRPISVHDWNENTLVIIYKVVGRGTEQMAEMKKGEKLDILTGLGNGYTVTEHKNVAVIGGGVGVPPLYALAKKLKKEGKNVTAILGFNSADQVFCKEDFEKVCDNVVVTTADGSMGVKGFVTTPLADMNIEYFYACGPEPMLKALYQATDKPGQYSFEARMACGFGACMGCSCKTKYGTKRICKDGPVLNKEEIVW